MNAFTTTRQSNALLKYLKYWAIARVNYFQNLVYPVDLFTLGLMVAFRIWVFTQLYRATFTQSHLSEVGGLTLPMTIWLLAFTQSYQLSSGTRSTILRLSEDIKNGNIAYTINRPFSFLGYLYASALGRLSARLIATLVMSAAAAMILVGGIAVTWQAVLAGILLGVLGVSLNLLISMGIGLLAFWTEDTSAFRWVYDKLQWTFGGMIVPLSLFPAALMKVVEYTPFAQVFYASARLFVGFNISLFWRYLGIQAGWIAIMLVLVTVMFRKGVKNVSINGG